MSGLTQNLGSPLINALSLNLRGGSNGGMNIRAYAQHQITGIGFLWLLSTLFANRKVVIHRLAEMCS